MFWIGFLSIPLILLMLFGLMAGSGKLLNKIEKNFIHVKAVVCAVVFTFLSYVFTLLYSMVAIISGNAVINAMLCALFLVFSWYIVEKMYQKISGENFENKAENENEKALSHKDKNVCHLCALIAVVCSSVLLCIEKGDRSYLMLTSIAISVWIGAYIPISEIYQGIKFKVTFENVIKEFKNQKLSVVFSAVISAVFMIFLVSENDLAQKLNVVIEEIGVGIAAGSISVILGMVAYGLIKNRKCT